MVEIAKAVSYEFRRPDHGRADLGADREARSTHLFEIIRDLQGAGQGHRLHHPQDERAVRDRRRGLGVPRRQYIGTHAARTYPRRHHPHDGRPRDHPDVPQGGRADRRGRALGRESLRSRACSTTSRSSCARGEILGMAGLVGSGRSNVAETIFGVTPATSGQIEIRGKPVDDRLAAHRHAARHGVPHRGPQGDRLLPDPRHPREHADGGAAARRYVKGGFVDEGAVGRDMRGDEGRRCGSRRPTCTSGS